MSLESRRNIIISVPNIEKNKAKVSAVKNKYFKSMTNERNKRADTEDIQKIRVLRKSCTITKRNRKIRKVN